MPRVEKRKSKPAKKKPAAKKKAAKGGSAGKVKSAGKKAPAETGAGKAAKRTSAKRTSSKRSTSTSKKGSARKRAPARGKGAKGTAVKKTARKRSVKRSAPRKAAAESGAEPEFKEDAQFHKHAGFVGFHRMTIKHKKRSVWRAHLADLKKRGLSQEEVEETAAKVRGPGAGPAGPGLKADANYHKHDGVVGFHLITQRHKNPKAKAGHEAELRKRGDAIPITHTPPPPAQAGRLRHIAGRTPGRQRHPGKCPGAHREGGFPRSPGGAGRASGAGAGR